MNTISRLTTFLSRNSSKRFNALSLRLNSSRPLAVNKESMGTNESIRDNLLKKMAGLDMSMYVISNETPVCHLDATSAFKELSEKEKMYAHYIAKASFDGALSVFLQVSPESPAIFYIIYHLFKSEPIDALKQKALAVGFSEDDWTALLVYCASFYSNSGNYKGFGDTKFIPGLPKEKLDAFLTSTTCKDKIIHVWNEIKECVYCLDSNKLQLDFGNKGVTTYHSKNITKEDAELIDRLFKKLNIESWNTRLFKETNNGETIFRVVMASEKKEVVKEVEFENKKVIIERGDYSPLMKKTHEWLEKAKEFSANENQTKMLENYVNHFKNGDISLHKDGSRFWIKDVSPTVESYIGFIENYRDPAGTRSEFEGFVAAVNKETSKKFQTLVKNAENILKRLPWGEAYEKDTFLKPDFTALDVIAFASSGIPAGINIPNYDDIRQNEGFKNVSLGNVIAAQPKQKMNFIDDKDEDLMFKYHKDSFEVQVGLHELLGHGSGKLFFRNQDGTFNFNKETTKDIITGKEVTSWYEPGETWSSKFGPLASAYEECRAEAVGYVLCCDSDILEIFGYTGDIANKVKYVNWLSEIRAGLMALEFYQSDKKKWGQAHCYARYVLLKVVLEAGQDFVKITECADANGKPDLMFKLDESKIDSVGKPAVSAFLNKLQAYKSTGDFEGGKKLFEFYGNVGETELKWRDICINRKKPRRIFVQPNTFIENGKVDLRTYPAEFTGVVQSFVDRYNDEAVENLIECWKDNKKWFN